MEENGRQSRQVVYTSSARLPRTKRQQGERLRVFTVTVKYSGQPERNAGDYPSRDAAARAAARLAATTGPDGQRPVGVSIHDSHREPPVKASA